METLSLTSLIPHKVHFLFPGNVSTEYCLAEGRECSRIPRRPLKDGPENRRSAGNRVLLIGRIWELALYRAEVLRAHGFRVLTPRTPKEAVDMVRRGQFDIAILTYTLSNDVIQELAEQIRQHCPRCPLIAISDNSCSDQKIFPDQVVLADEGPSALIAALQRVSKN